MRPTVRRYDRAADYEAVGRFLVRTYLTTAAHANWLQPRWEYMHYHPLVRGLDLRTIGVWEADGAIVGVAHPEDSPGTVYVEIDPGHEDLKGQMLEWAWEQISASREGVRRVRVYVDDQDGDFQRLASELGYAQGTGGESMSELAIRDPFPPIALPHGFRLTSLAEDNDLAKVDRVLWRGFNHGDEPPADGPDDRAFMQSAPNFRKELNIVVAAPDGQFVSYAGMWYEPVHAVVMVEPVATDPDYRRMGLGRAAVLEGVRRCGALGARVAYVGSGTRFYLSMGFRPVRHWSAWQRESGV